MVAHTISPIPSAASRAPCSVAPGRLSRTAAAVAVRAPERSMPRAPAARTSAGVGSGAGCHGSSGCSTSAGTGERSKITVARSTPAMPSIIAWWLLLMSAKRPPASPSISHSSHSGRARSSCWEKIRPASSSSWSASPGAGSALWRTWYSMLKVGSSTHSGRPGPAGGTASFWR
jgi:hypothetical protein